MSQRRKVDKVVGVEDLLKKSLQSIKRGGAPSITVNLLFEITGQPFFLEKKLFCFVLIAK